MGCCGMLGANSHLTGDGAGLLLCAYLVFCHPLLQGRGDAIWHKVPAICRACHCTCCCILLLWLLLLCWIWC